MGRPGGKPRGHTVRVGSATRPESTENPAAKAPGGRAPRNISVALFTFLRQHESLLRDMAAKEHAEGTFTRGLWRCLDILDDEAWPR